MPHHRLISPVATIYERVAHCILYNVYFMSLNISKAQLEATLVMLSVLHVCI